MITIFSLFPKGAAEGVKAFIVELYQTVAKLIKERGISLGGLEIYDVQRIKQALE